MSFFANVGNQTANINNNGRNDLPMLELRHYRRDQKEGIFVFLPLLSKLSPMFASKVIGNQQFLQSLSKYDRTVLQIILDERLCSPSKVKPTSLELIAMLYLIDEHGSEFPKFNQIKTVLMDQITMSNVVSQLIEIDTYLIKKETNEMLKEMKNKCLDLIIKNLYTSDYVSLVDSDLRFEKYARTVLKRMSTMGKPVVNTPVGGFSFGSTQQGSNTSFNSFYVGQPSTQTVASNNGGFCFGGIPSVPSKVINLKRCRHYEKISELFNDKTTSVVELSIGEETIYCHKTILMSFSDYFRTQFNGSWNESNLVFEKPWKYYIQYLYCIKPLIPDSEIVETLDISFMNQDKEFSSVVLAHFQITTHNFFVLLDQFSSYIETSDENIQNMVKPLYEDLLNFANKQSRVLFPSEDSLRMLPDDFMRKLLLKKIRNPNEIYF